MRSAVLYPLMENISPRSAKQKTVRQQSGRQQEIFRSEDGWGRETSGCDKLTGHQNNRQSRELNTVSIIPTNREKIFCGIYFEYKGSLICCPYIISSLLRTVMEMSYKHLPLLSCELLNTWQTSRITCPSMQPCSFSRNPSDSLCYPKGSRGGSHELENKRRVYFE